MRQARLLSLLPALILVAGLALVLSAWPLPQHAAAQQQPTPTPLPLYALPNPTLEIARSSGSIAISPYDGRIIATANMFSDSITLAVPTQNRVQAEIPVGDDPRGVAFTPNGDRVLAANRGDGTLTIADALAGEVLNTVALGDASNPAAWPYHVVAASGERAYVSLIGSAEVAEVDLMAGVVSRRIPVEPYPAALAAWGDFLYVTHFWNGRVTLIYQPTGQVVQTARVSGDVGASQHIELDITRGLAYLPQTQFNSQNPTPIYDTLAYPAVNVLRLSDLQPIRGSRVDLSVVDQPMNLPFAAALDRFNRRLYVVSAGSDRLSVIDLPDNELRASIEVGGNPRGIVLSTDYARAYIHNTLDGTITTLNTSSLEVESVLPITQITGVSVDVLIGAGLFHSAEPRMAAGGWLSCATCHFDGMSDSRVWAGMGTITGLVTEGETLEQHTPARNTPLLYGMLETVPYNAAQSWDELADSELKIRALMGGQGLIDTVEGDEISESLPHPALGAPNGGLSPDLDALVTYMLSLQSPPARTPDEAATSLIARGEVVFSEQGCASCHVGTVGTNLQAYDVGTGGEIDTPSLRWLWLSAPYYHDGSAPTLAAVLASVEPHRVVDNVPQVDLDALEAYLLMR